VKIALESEAAAEGRPLAMIIKNVMKKANKTLRLIAILCLIIFSVSIELDDRFLPSNESTRQPINYFLQPGIPQTGF